jgi:hypothetical protein
MDEALGTPANKPGAFGSTITGSTLIVCHSSSYCLASITIFPSADIGNGMPVTGTVLICRGIVICTEWSMTWIAIDSPVGGVTRSWIGTSPIPRVSNIRETARIIPLLGFIAPSMIFPVYTPIIISLPLASRRISSATRAVINSTLGRLSLTACAANKWG